MTTTLGIVCVLWIHAVGCWWLANRRLKKVLVTATKWDKYNRSAGQEEMSQDVDNLISAIRKAGE